MQFEGPEKKLEIVVSPDLPNLRSLGKDYWYEIVAACRAQVLSHTYSSGCDAYLLSESSLFVMEDRFVMITCGQTELVQSALLFFERFPKEMVKSVIYERKNEYFPHLQPTDFFSDVHILKEIFPGEIFHFGKSDDHFLHLFHFSQKFKPSTYDTTLEILMYDLQGEAKQVFQKEDQSLSAIDQKTGVTQLLPNFVVDDYVFEPFGYSLNAVKEHFYYTLHVTPQDGSPYVSFETNTPMENDYLPLIKDVLSIFRPQSFDVVVFSPSEMVLPELKGFVKKRASTGHLGCGYQVSFSHFSNKKDEITGENEQ